MALFSFGKKKLFTQCLRIRIILQRPNLVVKKKWNITFRANKSLSTKFKNFMAIFSNFLLLSFFVKLTKTVSVKTKKKKTLEKKVFRLETSQANQICHQTSQSPTQNVKLIFSSLKSRFNIRFQCVIHFQN